MVMRYTSYTRVGQKPSVFKLLAVETALRGDFCLATDDLEATSFRDKKQA